LFVYNNVQANETNLSGGKQMTGNRLIAALAAGVFILALALPGLAQGPPPPQSPAPQTRPAPKVITVQGKIAQMKAMGGYYLRSRPEVFKIANQNPAVLGPLAKSGKTVTIEAQYFGDLLTILKIDGKKYQGAKGPTAK
jgi:hypothetical protein